MSDKLKSFLGWSLIISVLLLAWSAIVYSRAFARSGQAAAARSFSVSGEGRAVVVPDIARFSFRVITEGGNDIGKLQDENTKKVNQAIALLKERGIEAKDIKTESYDLAPRYQNVTCRTICPPPAIVGYHLEQSVAVKVRAGNFAKIGDLLSGLVSAGVNSVSQLNFTLDDPTTVENEARALAIAEAKAKAKTIARAAGFSLGDLLSIDEGGVQPYFLKASSMEAGMVPSVVTPTIEPGSQEVRVNLTLRYEID